MLEGRGGGGWISGPFVMVNNHNKIYRTKWERVIFQAVYRETD